MNGSMDNELQISNITRQGHHDWRNRLKTKFQQNVKFLEQSTIFRYYQKLKMGVKSFPSTRYSVLRQ
ncbi:hypothetical protein C7B82_23150 [Stenomitos frigidus ULC18]|uniref:Uncharacterized protein n=1 Tax=Stenomitos frigidus ULC18 TaxID=2107698 RepID=A0A2T1DYK5_9CYAN|nr:hypothetical protein C7B82_23150 [Stenomitos frigidus ULC18]